MWEDEILCLPNCVLYFGTTINVLMYCFYLNIFLFSQTMYIRCVLLIKEKTSYLSMFPDIFNLVFIRHHWFATFHFLRKSCILRIFTITQSWHNLFKWIRLHLRRLHSNNGLLLARTITNGLKIFRLDGPAITVDVAVLLEGETLTVKIMEIILSLVFVVLLQF